MTGGEVKTVGWKRPESVLVLICTRAGEVLLLERTRPPGFWQSVTGSLRWGEDAAAAARREVFEETGLRSHALRDLGRGERFRIVGPWRARYAPDVRFNREHWFELLLDGRRTVHLSRHEHRQCRWLPAAVAAQRATSWTNRKLIRQWMAARGL
jgi:dihydroneopterin triphosphate diphosphatase